MHPIISCDNVDKNQKWRKIEIIVHLNFAQLQKKVLREIAIKRFWMCDCINNAPDLNSLLTPMHVNTAEIRSHAQTHSFAQIRHTEQVVSHSGISYAGIES